MNTRSLYCSVCEKHTLHQDLPAMYATRCTVCNTQTSGLIRMQAASAALASRSPMLAPDGTQGQVVENNPKKIVFFVPDGPHKGYYHYDKQRKTYAIVAA